MIPPSADGVSSQSISPSRLPRALFGFAVMTLSGSANTGTSTSKELNPSSLKPCFYGGTVRLRLPRLRLPEPYDHLRLPGLGRTGVGNGATATARRRPCYSVLSMFTRTSRALHPCRTRARKRRSLSSISRPWDWRTVRYPQPS